MQYMESGNILKGSGTDLPIGSCSRHGSYLRPVRLTRLKGVIGSLVYSGPACLPSTTPLSHPSLLTLYPTASTAYCLPLHASAIYPQCGCKRRGRDAENVNSLQSLEAQLWDVPLRTVHVLTLYIQIARRYMIGGSTYQVPWRRTFCLKASLKIPWIFALFRTQCTACVLFRHG
jgi:hypothetical protein